MAYRDTESFLESPAPTQPVQEQDPYAPFFEKLAAHPRKWFLYEGRAIRCATRGGSLHCPISAALNDQSVFVGAWRQHERLGISRDAPLEIVRAADGAFGHNQHLRARLIAATINGPRPPSATTRLLSFFSRARSALSASRGRGETT